MFLLLNECFTKNSKLYIIIKNSINLNYSCMANIKQKLDNNYNGKIMGERRRNLLEPASAETKHHVHLKRKCLEEVAVYKAILTQTEWMRQDTYIGMKENHFKTR